MLNSALEQVIFLSMMGYSRERIEGATAETFPAEDFDSLWTQAQARMEEAERGLDAAVARDDKRAVDAEHDTNLTMWDNKESR